MIDRQTCVHQKNHHCGLEMIEHPLPPREGFRPYLANAVETPFGWLVELRHVGQGREHRSLSGVYWLSLEGKFTKTFPESNHREERLHVSSVASVEWTEQIRTDMRNMELANSALNSGNVTRSIYLQNDGTLSPSSNQDHVWINSKHHVGCYIINNIYQKSTPLQDRTNKSFGHTNKELAVDSVLVWMFALEKQGLLVANPQTKEFKVMNLDASSHLHRTFMGIDTILVCTEQTFIFLDIPIEK